MQFLLLLAACMACFAAASDITLYDLQPIADFSFSCSEAYNITLPSCDNTLFAPFDGEASCSQSCLSELNTLARALQRACQTDGVKPDTVIAHAFQGDLANWLCEMGSYATQQPTVASGTATNAKFTSTMSAAATSSASASTSSVSSSNSTSSSASSITTSFSTTTVSTTATTVPSPSTTTSSKPRQTSHTIGDSTPFDQTVQADIAGSTRVDKRTLLLVQILVPTLTSFLVVGIGGWMY